MSSFVVALVFGIGVAAFVWSKLSQHTGNAHPTNVITASVVSGTIAALVLLSILKWILGLS